MNWFNKKELTIKDCKCKFKRNGKFKPCKFHKQCIGSEPCATGISVCNNLIHMKQNGFDEKGNYIK